MLNRYNQTHPSSYCPQSVPSIQHKSMHNSSSQSEQSYSNNNGNYLSDTYENNQNQTKRGPPYNYSYENEESFKIKNNNQYNLNKQQVKSYKLNRISDHKILNQGQDVSYNFIKQEKKNINLLSSNEMKEKYKKQDRVEQCLNNTNMNMNKIQSKEDRMGCRPKSGHLVSFGSLSPFKQSPSMPNSNHNTKNNSSLNYNKFNQKVNIYDKENSQKLNIYDKENNQPNSNYNTHQRQQKELNINKSNLKYQKQINQNQNTNYNHKKQINQIKQTQPLLQHTQKYNNTFNNNTTTLKSQSHLLLPILNTKNNHHQFDVSYHSNSIIDESSISPHCDSSRISQQDTQNAYLKQKLIETHTKLIKQLEISKQLEDNFFTLKKKYQILLLSTNKINRPQENQQTKINQLEYQLKKQYEKLEFKQEEYKEKERSRQQQSNCKQNEYKQEVKKLKMEIQKYKELIYNYKLTFQEKEKENEELRSQLTEMTNNQIFLTQKVNQLQINRYSSRDLQQIIHSKETALNQQINQQKNSIMKESQKLIEKNQQLKNDLETMRNKVLLLNKQKEQLVQELQQLNQSQQNDHLQISQLQQKLNKKNKQLTEKEELSQIWRKKYSETQEDSKKISETIIKHQSQIKQLKNLNSQLNIALRQEKQKNAQMLSEIINIQMESKELKFKINNLQQQKKQLQDKLFQVTPQKNIIHLKQQLQHQLQKLTNEYNSLSAIINKKDRQISELKGQLLQNNLLVNKLLAREKEIEQKSREFDQLRRELEDRQRQFEEQKVIKMNSVKSFVNQLQDRSVALKRNTQQTPRQNRAFTPSNIQRQNVFNNSNLKNEASCNNSRSLSSFSVTNSKIPTYQNKTNQITFDQPYITNHHQNYHQQNQTNYQQNQLQNIPLTTSKSLNNLNVKKITQNHSNNNFNPQKDNFNQQKDNFNQQKDNLMNPKTINQNNYLQQNTFPQYQSYQDSLQTNNLQTNTKNERNPIKTQFQLKTNDIGLNQKRNNRSNISLTPLKNKQNNISVTQTKIKGQNGSQKCLSSYKQEKQQYLCLLQQIGQFETQSYNLGQEKKKILQEIERIENTKVKTKEMIGKRRQLELWLLGNEKKNNQIKEKLRIIRGKVV